jgi:hypothetical protein
MKLEKYFNRMDIIIFAIAANYTIPKNTGIAKVIVIALQNFIMI